MKTVGVREFRDHVLSYCAGSDLIAVTNRDTVIGFYIPLPCHPEETQRAVERLSTRFQEMLRETGTSAEQLAELLRLRNPQS